MKKSKVQIVVVVGRKRENREKRGSVFCVCACVCACVRTLPAQYGSGNASASARKGKEGKKSSWRRNDDGRRSRSQPRRGAMSSLVWRLETVRLPGGVWCVRCAVCHIQCATFAQDYLLSLLSPNNFSPNNFSPNKFSPNNTLTVSQSRHSHRFTGNFSCLPASYNGGMPCPLPPTVPYHNTQLQ